MDKALVNGLDAKVDQSNGLSAGIVIDNSTTSLYFRSLPVVSQPNP